MAFLYFENVLYLSLSISHFNLAYLDLCKFKLFYEPPQCGLVFNEVIFRCQFLFSFLGVPQTLHFGGLILYFDNFFVRKTVGSRETPQGGLLVRRMLINKNLEFSPRPSVCSSVRPFVRPFIRKYLEIRSLLFLKLCS